MTADPTAPLPIPDAGTPSWAGTLVAAILVLAATPAAILGLLALRDRLSRRRTEDDRDT